MKISSHLIKLANQLRKLANYEHLRLTRDKAFRLYAKKFIEKAGPDLLKDFLFDRYRKKYSQAALNDAKIEELVGLIISRNNKEKIEDELFEHFLTTYKGASNEVIAQLYMQLDPNTFLEVYHPGYN